MHESLTIPVDHPHVEAVSGSFTAPADSCSTPRASAILLANGAGLNHTSPFMTRVAEGLAARGFPVLRFDYPYQERAVREGRRRPPDATPRLEAAHERAATLLAQRLPDHRLILAGKSMGARMSSHLAAKDFPCRALCYFGYPLHPARRPEKLRAEHFAAIVQPTLFLQGTRDDLCDLELLRRELGRYGGRVTLEVVDDADHSFHVRKRSGRTDDEVLEGLLDRVAAWEAEVFPS